MTSWPGSGHCWRARNATTGQGFSTAASCSGCYSWSSEGKSVLHQHIPKLQAALCQSLCPFNVSGQCGSARGRSVYVCERDFVCVTVRVSSSWWLDFKGGGATTRSSLSMSAAVTLAQSSGFIALMLLQYGMGYSLFSIWCY